MNQKLLITMISLMIGTGTVFAAGNLISDVEPGLTAEQYASNDHEHPRTLANITPGQRPSARTSAQASASSERKSSFVRGRSIGGITG